MRRLPEWPCVSLVVGDEEQAGDTSVILGSWSPIGPATGAVATPRRQHRSPSPVASSPTHQTRTVARVVGDPEAIAKRRANFHSTGNGSFVPGDTYWDTCSHSELMKMRGYVQVNGVWK
jgi:hypothetical protein